MTASSVTKIAISIAPTPDKQRRMLDQIRAGLGTLDGLDIVFAAEDSDLPGLMRDREVLLTDCIRPGVVENAPRLKWVQLIVAGVEVSLTPQVLAHPVVITNARGMHVIQMAEHVVGMMLAFSRGLPECFRGQQAREWRQRTLRKKNFTLSGLVAGVLGLGAIGHGVATRLKALGMTVIGTRRAPDPLPDVDQVFGQDGTNAVLERSDFVVVVLPHTAQTHRILGAAQFARMKKSAYLINIARGAIVDEVALVSALSTGRIAGAALDVFDVEPLPSDSPLWGMDNCIISPHCSGNYPDYVRDSVEIFIRNLARYRGGQKLDNVVDKTRGY